MNKKGVRTVGLSAEKKKELELKQELSKKQSMAVNKSNAYSRKTK